MGYNIYGALGDDTLVDYTNLPEATVITNVTAVAAGGYHSLYLQTDGTLWGSGDEEYGQLGNGISGENNFDMPITTNVHVMVLASNVTSVSAGYFHTMFIATNGSLWATGDDSNGELGDSRGGTGVMTNMPEMIVASNVTSVAAGLYSTFFIMTNGSLWAMGRQAYGELGDGVAGQSGGYFTNKPELIVNSNVAAVATGGDHSLYVTSNGFLYAMGYDGYGELGDTNGGFIGGNPQYVTRPEMITNGVTAVAAGADHSLFIMTNGSLWAMGNNEWGQLGNGNTNNQYAPVMIEPSNVTAIACGQNHSLFLMSDGSLWGMGSDFYGELGNGQSTNGTYFGFDTPQLIASNVTSISAGQYFSTYVAPVPPAPQILVYDGITNIVNNQITPIYFPTVLQDSTPPVVVITVTNPGVLPLTLGPPTVGSVFGIVTNPPASIPGGGSGMFAVQMATTNPQTFNSQVSFTNNVDGRTPYTFPISGTVTGIPGLVVYFSNNIIVTNGQSTIDFGSAPLNATGPSIVFVISNSGAANLQLGTATVSPGYVITSHSAANVAFDSFTTLGIQMATTNSGTINGTVSFTNNVAGASPFTFSLTGTVTTTVSQPAIAVSYGTNFIVNGQTNAVSFGAAQQNTTGPIITFTVTNPGAATLDLGQPTVGSNFTVVTNPPATIVAGGSGTFSVQLLTTALGAWSNNLALSNNVPGNNPFAFPLAGVVISVTNSPGVPSSNTIIVTSYPPEGGTAGVINSNAGNLYPAGSVQSLQATPANGFQFVGWEGNDDIGGSSNPLQVTADANLFITAYFTAVSSSNLIVTVNTNGSGSVAPDLNNQDLKKGRRYTLTAEADAGNLFLNWTGSIATNRNPLTFVAESNMVLQANFASNIFLTLQGTYYGLFTNTNSIAVDSAGMLKALKVTAKGAYTGDLLLGGAAYPLSGIFSGNGRATNLIKRPAAAGGAVTVAMKVFYSNSIAQVGGAVIGTNNGALWVADLNGNLTDTNQPAGQYTMLVEPDTNSMPPTNSPGGYSYALITNHLGTAKITGALADGTTLSQTVGVGGDHSIPVYSSLYNGKGLLLGWINLDPSNANNVSLTWINPGGHTVLYKSGFTNSLSAAQILVSQWTTPTDFSALTNLSHLITVGDTNGAVDAGIDVSSSGKITGVPTSENVSGAVTPKTGLVTVTIRVGEARATVHGALLTPTNGGGYILNATSSTAVQLGP